MEIFKLTNNQAAAVGASAAERKMPAAFLLPIHNLAGLAVAEKKEKNHKKSMQKMLSS